MSGLRAVLEPAGLEKYTEQLEARGIGVEELRGLDLDGQKKLCEEIGMLKGHGFKLQKVIQDLKSGKLGLIKPSLQTGEVRKALKTDSRHSMRETLKEFQAIDLDYYLNALYEIQALQEAINYFLLTHN